MLCKNEALTLSFVSVEFEVTRTSLFLKFIITEDSWFNTQQNNAATNVANALLQFGYLYIGTTTDIPVW